MSLSDAKLFSTYSEEIFKYGFKASFHMHAFNQAYFQHYHDYYEVVFYLGEAPLDYDYQGETYTIRRGDVVLCDMFKPHMYKCSRNEHYDRFSISISPKLLTYFSVDIDYTRLFKEQNEHYPVCHTDFSLLSKYLKQIMEYRDFLERDGEIGVQRAMLHLLLSHLYNDCLLTAKGEATPQEMPSAKLILVDNLIHYIDTHLGEKITLEELSGAANYSVSYISQVFREFTGETLLQYITEKRLLRARQLFESDLSLTEIARRCGFEDYSHFYKCFVKAEGLSPAEARRSSPAYGIASISKE